MSFPPRVRKEGASMFHKTIKKKKHLLYGVVIAVSIVLLLSGIFSCIKGENPALHEIVSFDTSYYGTERNPVYAFALRKEDGNWLFSASCPVGDRKNHYTSFGPFPIPAADVEGFLAILRETDEIARLRRYRKPVWTRFIHISDAPARSSGMTFTDGNSIRKETSISEQALDYLYALADKHHQAAENAEMKAVSINRSCMDHSSSYSFTLEKDGNHWPLCYTRIGYRGSMVRRGFCHLFTRIKAIKQSSRRTNGIRCLWKPCKEKAISNICWMFFCTAQPRKRRLWLPSKEKR